MPSRPAGQHRHRCRRDQPVGRAGEQRNRRVEQQEAGGVAGLRRAAQLRPVGRQRLASSATDCGGSSTPSFADDEADLGDVLVALLAAVRGRRRTGGGRAGSCRPRRRGPSAAGAGRRPGRPDRPGRCRGRCRGPPARGRRRVRRRRRIRTWWRRGTGWFVAGGPTGRRGSRSARRLRPSPADEGTAGRGPGAHRRTSRRRRGRCGSPHPRGTIAGPGAVKMLVSDASPATRDRTAPARAVRRDAVGPLVAPITDDRTNQRVPM